MLNLQSPGHAHPITSYFLHPSRDNPAKTHARRVRWFECSAQNRTTQRWRKCQDLSKTLTISIPCHAPLTGPMIHNNIIVGLLLQSDFYFSFGISAEQFPVIIYLKKKTTTLEISWKLYPPHVWKATETNNDLRGWNWLEGLSLTWVICAFCDITNDWSPELRVLAQEKEGLTLSLTYHCWENIWEINFA